MPEQIRFDFCRDLPQIKNPIRGRLFKPIRDPIWTENKAKLIEKYLYYFVMITHHGAYIDGFAGPQEPEKPEMWAAKLVLESKPRWLRQFFLCDSDPQKALVLENLVKSQPAKIKTEPNRLIKVYSGDFNKAVHEILRSGLIKENEATFCLLDQRTFECQWSTVETLAKYRKNGYKVELFYFLGVKWLLRALSATRDKTLIDNWWGNPNWSHLIGKNIYSLRDIFCERFKDELGYSYCAGWPIFERKEGGSIMYFMIHATDHPDAPPLMERAYRYAVYDKEPISQFEIDFKEWKSSAPPRSTN